MSGRCEECGASTVWDSDVGSAICLECGTLADPTQSVLASHLENVDVSGRDFAPWVNVPGGSTLRGRNGWALSGQGKEARDRKNTVRFTPSCGSICNLISACVDFHARVHTGTRYQGFEPWIDSTRAGHI